MDRKNTEKSLHTESKNIPEDEDKITKYEDVLPRGKKRKLAGNTPKQISDLKQRYDSYRMKSFDIGFYILFRKLTKDSTPECVSKHVMLNDAKEQCRGDEFSEQEKNLQRYDELKKVFGLLKQEWPYCFDNTQESYLSRAEIAVS